MTSLDPSAITSEKGISTQTGLWSELYETCGWKAVNLAAIGAKSRNIYRVAHVNDFHSRDGPQVGFGDFGSVARSRRLCHLSAGAKTLGAAEPLSRSVSDPPQRLPGRVGVGRDLSDHGRRLRMIEGEGMMPRPHYDAM